MDPSQRRRESGVALIAVVLILTLLMGLAVGMTTSILMDTGLRGAFQRTTTGFYAAEAGLNRGMGGYRNMFLNFHIPSGSDFNPSAPFSVGTRQVVYDLGNVPGSPQDVVIPLGQLFGGLNSRQYTYVVNSSAQANGETEANVGAEFNVGNIPMFQFLAFYINDLEIAPGPIMNLTGRVHTNGNLYLNANATLTIGDNQAAGITTVQVSAKGDIYRGRKDTNSCTGTVIVDMLQDVASPHPDLDPKTLACNGGGTTPVQPATLSTWLGSMVSRIQSIAVPGDGMVVRGAGNSFWDNANLRIVLVLNKQWVIPANNPPANNNGVTLPHSIEVQDSSGNTDATKTNLLRAFMASARPASQFPNVRPIYYTDTPVAAAGCSCTDAAPATCTSTLTNVNATGVSACYPIPFNPLGFPGGTAAIRDARVYTSNMMNDQDYRRGGFYNWREGRWMYLLNINLRDLLTWNMAQPNGSQLFNPAETNGGGVLIYVSVMDANNPNQAGATNYGVRIFGSALLPFPALSQLNNDPNGVTVVSDQAIYVLGDYNAPNPPGPFNPANLWQPTALIGDSVNVLSNSYFNPAVGTCINDCQSNRSLADANRRALNTTINAAFLGGVDTTNDPQVPGSAYNGGFENYPRFHEDWGTPSNPQPILYYLGSFVSLGKPRHATGAWCGTGGTFGPPKSGCNIYNPPVRTWNYDPNFNSLSYIPPFTPEFVYVQQVLFTEEFK